MNNNMNIARTLTFIGAIMGIVSGALWCFTIIGVLWGVPTIIGGVVLLKFKDYSAEKKIKSRVGGNTLLC